MRVRVLPYKAGSASAKALAVALGAKRINLVRTRFRPRTGDVIVNWGNTRIAVDYPQLPTIINKMASVAWARDKLLTFQKLTEHNVPTVEWTTDPAQAVRWYEKKATVFERQTLTGQGGAGIVVCTQKTTAPSSGHPLYTKYFDAKHEYRIHVVGNGIVDVQKKRRREGVGVSRVRNLANGYVYCRENVVAPDGARAAAVRAVAALGLDFGAVDILCKEDGRVAVLEVNTAPGLEGTTVDNYARALRTEILLRGSNERSRTTAT